MRMLKIYSTKTGDCLNSNRTFVEHLKKKVQLTEAPRWEECDVILKFCPVASRPGPDIESALEKIPANKPAVLVVMYHNCQQNYPVHNTNAYLTEPDVIIVNCLFHEQMGLFKCQANEEALEKTLTHVKKYLKSTPPAHQSQDKPISIPHDSLELTPVQDMNKEICIPHDSLEHTPVPDMNKETSKEGLRKKIKEISPTAEENLRDAGLTDDEILTLTLLEVSELLPGINNFKKRREIMALIKEPSFRRETSKEGLRQKIKEISPTAEENLRDAGLTDDEILTLTLLEVSELLPGIKNLKKRREIMALIKEYSFRRQQPGPGQEEIKYQDEEQEASGNSHSICERELLPAQHIPGPSSVPDSKEEIQGKMQKQEKEKSRSRGHTSSNSLWEKISKISPEAARNLQDAGLRYTQICDLTLPQLEELLPEIEHLRMRRKIKDVIEKHCETSSLREKISCISQAVANKLQDYSDAEICTIIPTELNALFPGLCNFLNRRDIMSLIQQHSKVPGAKLGHHEPPKMPEGQQYAVAANQLQGEPVVRNAEGEEILWKPLCDGKKSPELALQSEQASSSKTNFEAHQCSSVDAIPAQPAETATGLNSLPSLHAQRRVKVCICGDRQIAQILVQPMRSQIIQCSLEQSRVVLFFCAATSMKGEEIKAALRNIPDNKDTILVVGHKSASTWETARTVDINGKETIDFFFFQKAEHTDYRVNEHSISRLQEALQRYG